MKQPSLLKQQAVGVKQLVIRKLRLDTDAPCLIEGEGMVYIRKMLTTVVEKIAPTPEAIPVNADKVAHFP